jgi:hypothetical protein
MKLRIRDNTLRIRITQGELAKLASGQKLEQTTEFSTSAKLVTTVEPSAKANQCEATFAMGRIALQIPLREIRDLAETDRIGIESYQKINETRSLHLLIEKDFDCLHPKADENVDTFPNPKR